jgi:hypothetical protein
MDLFGEGGLASIVGVVVVSGCSGSSVDCAIVAACRNGEGFCVFCEGGTGNIFDAKKASNGVDGVDE